MATPSHNRVVPGSVNLPPYPWPATATDTANANPQAIAEEIIAKLKSALEKGDYQSAAGLFTANGFWRDHLALSWTPRTIKTSSAIAEYLASSPTKLKDVSLDLTTEFRKPQIASFAPAASPKVEGIAFFITLSTGIGSGRGVVRLIQEGREWKIWTMFTGLRELEGFEERVGARREVGVEHGGKEGRKNWRERREGEVEDPEPDVLIIAGQSGLTIAARLKMLGVKSLIIDVNEKVGDNWRKRYHQLVLHDPVWYDHMPYLPFPEHWPVFTPKDKLAEWFEFYAKALELNIWTSTTLKSSSWDENSKIWEVKVNKEGKEERVLKLKHVVLCTGHSGKKFMPDIKGFDEGVFKGLAVHSADFPGAKKQEGTERKRKAVVVGACNSAHDICQDYYEKGYDVTMVQRSSTCVVSNKAALKVLLAVLYEEGGPPAEDSDIWLHGWPSEIIKSIQIDLTKIQQEVDKDLLEGLEKAGFKTDKGIDEGGLFCKYLQRGGGYYIDVGMSQLIIDRKVKVKQGQEIEALVENGLKFKDGEILEADEIIFATGYENMRGQARHILGDEVADRVDDVWGWDSEGEMKGLWKGTGHPGFWFHGGNLALTRYFSRVTALQIKARLEGLGA
ncbi:putative monooxygenase [Triangularia verruculosa]|uniref:Monooxygenase n=1 Tax=Triangularia verruculosa TaxID=2587418 RepID=A0AAN6XQD2_9PEZI|nr:putative monooxygenase [Triangularia verruculosa]